MKSEPTEYKTASEILFDRFFRGRPEMERLLHEERIRAHLASLVYDTRTAAGLTQEQLAKKVGTTKSVISRLEDSDYNGHSLGILSRIGEALGCRTVITFQPLKAKRNAVPRSAVARPKRGAGKKRKRQAGKRTLAPAGR